MTTIRYSIDGQSSTIIDEDTLAAMTRLADVLDAEGIALPDIATGPLPDGPTKMAGQDGRVTFEVIED